MDARKAREERPKRERGFRVTSVGRSTYAVLGLCLCVRHQEEANCLVVALLAGQVERRELCLCAANWMRFGGRKIGLVVRSLVGFVACKNRVAPKEAASYRAGARTRASRLIGAGR